MIAHNVLHAKKEKIYILPIFPKRNLNCGLIFQLFQVEKDDIILQQNN